MGIAKLVRLQPYCESPFIRAYEARFAGMMINFEPARFTLTLAPLKVVGYQVFGFIWAILLFKAFPGFEREVFFLAFVLGREVFFFVARFLALRPERFGALREFFFLGRFVAGFFFFLRGFLDFSRSASATNFLQRCLSFAVNMRTDINALSRRSFASIVAND